MNCPHCHASVAVDARFCPICGKATVSTETTADVSGPLRAANEMIGREIVGRFRILAKLGEGGMGAVYRGEQIALKRACAIKVLRNELSANQMVLSRFKAEAEAIARLDHPNTVKVYDFGQDTDGSLFIAMEYIDGKALREIIQQGPLPPQRALRIALQVAASLIDAHAINIVHRDLKPDNVMLQDKNRQKDIVRVLDFGIAKLRDDSRSTQQAMTQAGDMLGTPQYMAPEQIKGGQIDGRTDIYALGCMIYEMVTARLPFEAATIMAMLSKHLMEEAERPSVRRPDLKIPPAIDQVVMMAMQKDPVARPATMEQYADMLANVLQSLPPDTQASGAMPIGAASAVQQAQHTPQPFPYVPTPQPQQPYGQPVQPVQTPQPASGAGGPYQPGFAQHQQPYAPPPIPPTMHVGGGSPKKSKLPLFLILGALALGGAGVGVWAATRNSDSPKPDDYRAHIDTPGDDHGSAAPAHHDDTPPPPPPPANNGGADPWATDNSPSGVPKTHTPRQTPHTPAKAQHEYTCDQIATKAITLATQEMQSKMASMTQQQIQQAVQAFQANVAAAYKKVVDECTSKDFSDAVRTCVMDAATFADASKCI